MELTLGSQGASSGAQLLQLLRGQSLEVPTGPRPWGQQESPGHPARPPGAPLQGSPEPPQWGHLRREVCHLTGAASAISPGSRQPRPQAASSTSLRRAPLGACASSLGQQCPLPGAQGHLTGATGASLISPAGSILLPREPSAPCAASVASGLRLRPAVRAEPRERSAGRRGNFLQRLSGFFLSSQRGSARAAAGRVRGRPLPSRGRINPSGRRRWGEEGRGGGLSQPR